MGHLLGPALEPVTLLFSISLFGFLMAAVSVSFSGVMPKQRAALIEWGKSMMAAGVAFLCFYYRGNAPWFLSFFIANVVVMGVPYLGLKAHLKLSCDEQQGRLAALVCIFGMSGVFGSYFLDVPRQAAVFTLSAATGAIWAATSFTIFKAMDGRTTPAALTAGVTFALMSLVFAVRAVATLADSGPSISPTSDSTLQVGLLVLGAIFIATSSISFFAMANDRQRLEIEEVAKRDGLTGIYNRTALFQQARELDSGSSTRSYAVVMFDIDHFKSINDTYGHGGGDVVLAHAARLIAGLARISDFVYRYGGEEFCVLLPDGGEQEASLFAQRVVAEARKQTVRLADGRTTGYAFSAGFGAKTWNAQLNRANESISDVIERADRALYEAKGAGRNRAVAAKPSLV